MEIILLYLLLGAVVGVTAGLLGVGGGLIIVPVLTFLFARQGFAAEIIVHLAIGTSLATIIFTSLSSIRAHHFIHRAVNWAVVKRLMPGIIVGALLGAVIADLLPAAMLRKVFGIFELIIAVQLAVNLKPRPTRTLPGNAGMFIAGNIIGSVSSVIGIGGGTMTVPFLTWCNITIQNAVATSSACGLPIAVAGTLGFIFTGWNELQLPATALGYVYLPALLAILASSIFTAPLGARLAHYLPALTLKRVFAVLLFFLGLRMLVG